MKLASTPIDQLNAASGTGAGGGNSNGGDATITAIATDNATDTITAADTVTTASAFMLSFRQEAGIQTGRKPPSPNHHSPARHPQ